MSLMKKSPVLQKEQRTFKEIRDKSGEKLVTRKSSKGFGSKGFFLQKRR